MPLYMDSWAYCEAVLRTIIIPFKVLDRDVMWGMANDTWGASITFNMDGEPVGSSEEDCLASEIPSRLHAISPNWCPATLIADNIYWLTEEWSQRFQAKRNHEHRKYLIEDADQAFWKVVADAYPEVTSGDFPIDLTFDMHKQMEYWVEVWLESNNHNPHLTAAQFRFVTKPEDDELLCDECREDVLKTGCWVADVPGYGAAGVRTECPNCHHDIYGV